MINFTIVCIGSNKIIEDSFGPRVGEILQDLYKNNSNINILGTMESPINFNNAPKILNELKNNEKNIVIAIDSAYGENLKIGSIYVNTGGIEIGKAFGKSLYLPANFSIKTVVENDYKSLIKKYRTKSTKEINRLEKINALSRNTANKVIKIIGNTCIENKKMEKI